jgi:Ran GTPase-activating protein (RanGAP) involved in mRNA processing and transport
MASIVQNLGTRCPLKTLNLARNDKIGSLDFSSSSSSIFPNLKQLDLSDCGLDAKSCTWLAQALSSTTELELKVNSNSNLGEQGTASLMGLSLKELHVSKCNIGDAGLQHIVNHSSNEVGLQILDLSHNNLSPTGIQYLANQLQEGGCSLPQLDELNIAGNQLDEASSQALAVAFGDLRIKEKLSISRLDMTDTSCGVNGAVDLIRLSQLKNLILFNNRLGSDGFVALAKVLQGGHPTLETLDVGGNEATEAGVVALVQAFTIKSESFQNALRLVVVGGNASGPTIETVVKEIKKVHPEMDIARDKAGKQQQQSDGTGQTQLPPGMLQT